MKNKFSENLKQLRIQFKLSQQQLADFLGSTQRKISFLETGAVEPDMDMILRIADFFDVTTDYLLGKDPI